MFCKKCGNQFSDNEKFCSKCGTLKEEISQSDISSGQMNNTIQKKNNTAIYIVVVIIVITIIISFVSSINHLNDKPKKSNNIKNNFGGENKKVNGQYTREVFSNNSFDYITSTDVATFTFNDDSTFEIKYQNGNSYRGTYEVYNGYFITVKSSEIQEDVSIPNNEQLALDINNTWTRMTEESGDLLNIYLLWLKTAENNNIQPFVIKYDSEKEEGISVNIMAKVQGTIIKK